MIKAQSKLNPSFPTCHHEVLSVLQFSCLEDVDDADSIAVLGNKGASYT